jgi:PIN domain nuclease of toxin-antitoxin system
LDASVILAVLFEEPGAEVITDDLLTDALVSTVNLAEVQSKLVKMGADPEDAWEDALSLGVVPEPYSTGQAKIAGTMIAKTKKSGLSLGDRSCLALAIERKAEVYTADRIWKNVKVGVPIHVIR